MSLRVNPCQMISLTLNCVMKLQLSVSSLEDLCMDTMIYLWDL